MNGYLPLGEIDQTGSEYMHIRIYKDIHTYIQAKHRVMLCGSKLRQTYIYTYSHTYIHTHTGQASRYVMWKQAEADPKLQKLIKWPPIKLHRRAIEKLIRSYDVSICVCVCVCVYVCVYIYAYDSRHTYNTYTYIHTWISYVIHTKYTYIHTYIHTHTQCDVSRLVDISRHAYNTYTYIHTYIRGYLTAYRQNTHIHTYIHTYIHTV